MLRIEVDIMSGRPNPEWIVTDPDVTKELLHAVAEAPGVAAKIGTGFTGLGYREVRVSMIEDDPQLPRGVPREFALASSASADFQSSVLLARRLIEDMTRHAEVGLPAHTLTPITPELRDGVANRFERFVVAPHRPMDFPLNRADDPWSEEVTTVTDASCDEACEYEASRFNPGFWNTPKHMAHNNCYNYALDFRSDYLVGPGFVHGTLSIPAFDCMSVAAAARTDGLVDRCDCLPDSEYPRRLVALATPADAWDFHWYRYHQGEFWAHKPGTNFVRVYDNNGAEIHNPEEADRGPYTEFCGYFYVGRSVVAGIKK